jgi:hypothetical protein
MSLPDNAFINKTAQPSSSDLASALSAAHEAWDQFLERLDRELAVGGQEWKCYSPKTGWALRVKRKARTIVWLAPATDCFTVAFILGAKAMQAVAEGTWPRRVSEAIAQATKYPEGTGVRLIVKSTRDLPALMKLAAIKIAH